jgi:hypothetical protein
MMVVVGLAIVVFLIYMAVKEYSSLRDTRPPEAHTGYKPSIKARARDRQENVQITLNGKGSSTSEAFYLDCALYRIQYQFPQDEYVTVNLASADGKSRKQILTQKSGYNSSSFNVDLGKYYIFTVETPNPETTWALVIRPL